jgi:hypothetical protein
MSVLTNLRLPSGNYSVKETLLLDIIPYHEAKLNISAKIADIFIRKHFFE